MPYKNKEDKKKNARLYYETHQEEIKEQSRQYREAHKEEIKQTRSIYVEEHKDYIADYMRKYRSTKEEYCIKGRILRRARARALLKDMEFNLDKQWIEENVASGVCSVTGLPFIYNSNCPFTPSIDRIDSSKGYTKDNCRIVCKIYNFAKNEFTDEDVMLVAEALVNKTKST